MLCLQFAIGSANDLADAATDAVAKPRKPIPAGLIARDGAVAVFAIAASLGLVLAATVSITALAVGALGLADGLLYDLRLKGTAFGWAPFAAGVGLLRSTRVWRDGDLPSAAPLVVILAVAAGAHSPCQCPIRSGAGSY